MFKVVSAHILFALLAFVASGCISAPSDPVALGELCEPEISGCENSVLLERQSVGRNQFDYTIENLGSQSADITVVVVTPEIESLNLLTIDPASVIDRQIHPNVLAGSKIGNRITAKLLGTRDSFRVFIICTNENNEACNLKLEYVFESIPVECFDDGDCSSGWLCNVSVGHCAECLLDEDCDSDQTCDSLQGRCSPENTTPSCSSGAPLSFLSIILFLLVLSFTTRRKTRGVILFVAFLSIGFVTDAQALSPPRATISAGGGMRLILGELGEDAQRGIGINITQALRWRHFGAAVYLGTSFYQTTQDPPPFSRGLGTYTVGIGPRFYLATGKNEFVLSTDIRRVGLLSNSLVRVTGLENDFSAASVGLGYRYHFEKIEVKFDANFAPFFSLPGSVLSFDVSIGFSSN